MRPRYYGRGIVILSGMLSALTVLAVLVVISVTLPDSHQDLNKLYQAFESVDEELDVSARALADTSDRGWQFHGERAIRLLNDFERTLGEVSGELGVASGGTVDEIDRLRKSLMSLQASSDELAIERRKRIVKDIDALRTGLRPLELELLREYPTMSEAARSRFIVFTMVGGFTTLLVLAIIAFYAIPRYMIRPMEEALEKHARDNASLRDREQLLSAVTDNVPIMICEVDAEGTVLYANPAFSVFVKGTTVDGVERLGNFFGCPSAMENERGCGYGTACGSCELRTAISECLALGVPSPAFEYSRMLPRGQGTEQVTLLGSAAPVDSSGSPSVLLCLQDISGRKQLEAELEAREMRFRSTVIP